MNWFTENPWPPVVLLAGIAVLFLILGQSKLRLAACVLLLLAVGVYFLEGLIVTPSEQVELRLQSIHRAFLDDDLATINSMIADESAYLRETAKKGLELVDLNDGFHLQDVVVKVSESGQSADVELRANGTVHVKEPNVTTHVPTRWKTKWVEKDGQWLLSEVQRLDPMTGNSMGILDQQ